MALKDRGNLGLLAGFSNSNNQGSFSDFVYSRLSELGYRPNGILLDTQKLIFKEFALDIDPDVLLGKKPPSQRLLLSLYVNSKFCNGKSDEFCKAAQETVEHFSGKSNVAIISASGIIAQIIDERGIEEIEKFGVPKDLIKHNIEGTIQPSQKLIRNLLIDNIKINPDTAEIIVQKISENGQHNSFGELLEKYLSYKKIKNKSFSEFIKQTQDSWGTLKTHTAKVIGIDINTYNKILNEDYNITTETIDTIARNQSLNTTEAKNLLQLARGNINQDINKIIDKARDSLRHAVDDNEKNKIIADFFSDCMKHYGYSDRYFAQKYGGSSDVTKMRYFNPDNTKGSLSNVLPSRAHAIAAVFTDDKELQENLALVLLKVLYKSQSINNSLDDVVSGKRDFANVIRQFRLQNGIGEVEFSKKIGMSPMMLKKIEDGEFVREINIKNLLDGINQNFLTADNKISDALIDSILLSRKKLHNPELQEKVWGEFIKKGGDVSNSLVSI